MLRPFVLLCRGATAAHQPKCQVHHQQLRKLYFHQQTGLLYEIIMEMKEQGHGSVKSQFSLFYLFIYAQIQSTLIPLATQCP